VADTDSGLQIVNATNAQSPYLAGSYDTPGRALRVFVTGGYAYIADASSLQIVDVSNPQSPFLAGSYDTPSFAEDVFVAGGYAYVVGWFSGLQIVNVSNPQSPFLAGSYDTPGWAQGVFVDGNYAYVADGNLQIVNVSNPQSPFLAGSYDTPDEAYRVFVTGGYAYVVGWFSGLQIVNVSNPQSPFLAGSYDTPYTAIGVFIADEYIYVADQSSLMILRFHPSGVEEHPALQPCAFWLSQNYPNPFNAVTSLSYSLDKTGPIELSIFNTLGQRVAVLISGLQTVGSHQAVWNAEGLPSGSYFARLEAGQSFRTVRLVLTK
jgi:hypothetical protein